MINFITIIKNILEEQGKTPQDLFESQIISENTFYKYKQRYPSLKTLIKLVNYLQVSIDYLFDFTSENNFSSYNLNNEIFYNKLIELIDRNKLSGRRFCKDLHYSRDNLIRWKNGTQPTVKTLFEISSYFSCTIDELLKK